MARLDIWDDKAKVKKILGERLAAAKAARKPVEAEWDMARRAIFGDEYTDAVYNLTVEGADTEDFDLGDRIDVQYAFRNFRLIHSHMSSNPPVAQAKPKSPDLSDKRASIAAGQVMDHFREELDIHEVNDITNVDVLVCGTGITRTGFDPNAGRILEFNEKTHRLKMEGEIKLERVPVDNFWPDPFAKSDKDWRHTFEMREFTREELQALFPRKWRTIVQKAKQSTRRPNDPNHDPAKKESKQPLYQLYWYYEPGNLTNAMLGRFAICLDDGELVHGPDINPNLQFEEPSLAERQRAEQSGQPLKRGPARAYLPYQVLTDIDITDRFWGRSNLFYVVPAQNLMANLDSATLESVKAHGLVRMVLPPGAKLAEGALSNSAVEVIQLEIEGQGDAHYMQPAGLPAAMGELRASMRMAVDDMWGVNESMFGQQSREQSGASMQYAVNQGALIRRRLFNKSVRFVKNQYKALLSLVVQHWDLEKVISILGEEGAYDAVEIMWMDVYGGYTLDVEYGTHLPLDPMARRDTIMQFMPMFKEAGIPMRSILREMRFGDFESFQHLADMAMDRAKEIVDRITTTKMQQRVYKYQDHETIMAYMIEFTNSADWAPLPEETKKLVEEHIDLRAQAAAAKNQMPGANPMGGASTGMPAMNPAPAGGANGGATPGVPALNMTPPPAA